MEHASGEKTTLLVVDDNEGVLDSIEEVLGENFRVLRARDALEALVVMRRVLPAMVFLDFMMPGINGLRLLREIKQMRVETKVVMITVNVREEIREEAFRLGVDAFFPKPFDVQEIRGLARRLEPATG
jgi:two-component system, response regulator, stage 0 sporulation protein F